MNFLSNLDQASRHNIISSMKMKMVQSGLTLFSVGADVSQELWILKSGRAKAVLKRPDGKYQRLSFLMEGSIMGLGSLLDGKPSPVTTNATEDCIFYRITTQNYESLLNAAPRLEKALLRETARVSSYRARSLAHS